jgi:uracil-DNA glycosylase
MAEKKKNSPDGARRAVVQRLESLERAGVTHLPKRRVAPKPAVLPSDSPPLERGGKPISASAPSTPLRKTAPPASAKAAASSPKPPQADDRNAALALLARRVAVCTRCDELARTRTQTVFGVGNPHARLVFLGEAPGADEDRQGEPFVGRAGQLLNKIIEACTLRREDVYILNILKCRPPGNRNPLPVEAAHCREYLDAQLAILRPEFICCLGAVAAQNLLQTDTPIGRLRGRVLEHQGIKVVCTYHPAYLLRNPAAKRQTWDDMQMLMAEMGIELPGTKPPGK